MANTDAFDSWLYQRLKELNTDETIFGPYIKSIVESDEDPDEKQEGLDGLLLELIPEGEVSKLRDEILKRWASCIGDASTGKFGSKLAGAANGQEAGLQNSDNVSNLDSKMEALLRMSEIDDEQSKQKELQNGTKGSSCKGTVDSELRAAILSQYREEDSDSENENDNHGSSGKKVEVSGISKNMNAEKVISEQREAKEKARAEQAKKREKDREDRAKQKKVAEERKEKTKKKATKVERKR